MLHQLHGKNGGPITPACLEKNPIFLMLVLLPVRSPGTSARGLLSDAFTSSRAQPVNLPWDTRL